MVAKRIVTACGYLRMSTDKQDTSIEIQRKRLLELAEKEGYEIIEWYVDEGCSGSRHTEKRVGWLRLLAEAPTAEWQVVLCFNRSRFSRLDSIEEGFAKQTLREAGKKLHTAQEGMMDWTTSSGRMIDVIHTEASNDYAAKVGYATLEGKLNAFLKGKSYGQKCPYAMARRLVDNKGEVHVLSRKENLSKPKDWTQTFIPGDPLEIETVQWIFQTFASKDVGYRWIGRELNAKGIPSPGDKKWCAEIVGRILTNATYVGDTVLGRRVVGKFARLDGDKVIKTDYARGEEVREGLVRKDSHQGIIDRELWDRVQEKIKRNSMQLPHLARGEGGYALKGIVFCGHCGLPLYGLRNKGPRKKGLTTYVCKNAVRYGNESGCAQWTIRERDILPFVIGRLTSEIDMRLLALTSVQPPATERNKKSPTELLEKKIRDLDKKIAQGTERFLLAPVELVENIKAMLDGWGAERKQLADQLEKSKDKAPSVEAQLKEWQAWFAATKGQLIHVQKSPEFGAKFEEGLRFTPEGFRETLRRFGCRVYCWWTQRSSRRYVVERIRVLLGGSYGETDGRKLRRKPRNPVGSGSAQSDTSRSVYMSGAGMSSSGPR